MTVKDLYALLQQEYEVQGRASARTAKWHIAPVLKRFGDLDVEALTPAMVEGYKLARLRENAARGTINNELALLRRAFNLAIEQGLIESRPRIRTLRNDSVRTGFLEPTQFQKLVAALEVLDRDVADLVTFLYGLGWRRSEAAGLRWSECDPVRGMIQLPANRVKNRTPRTVRLGEELRELLQRRFAERKGDFVFHRDGKRISDFRYIWRRAAAGIGQPKLLAHDMRRAFARNALAAGLDQRLIMEIAGWKTRSIFDRYRIVDEAEMSRGLDAVSEYVRGNRKVGP
jgi:integrase